MHGISESINLMHLRNCNTSDITYNNVVDTYTDGSISICQTYFEDNIRINNYVSNDQGLKYEFSQVRRSSGP